jgi:hypothetical protein
MHRSTLLTVSCERRWQLATDNWQLEAGNWKLMLGLLAVLWVATAERTEMRAVETGDVASHQLPGGASSGPRNMLTAAERAAGWQLLFDGKTTNGWHTFGRERVIGWEVTGGELIALGQGGDHANDIVTDAEFANFELVVDWKLSPQGNSGIFYHVVEQGFESAYASAPEYQLIDDDHWPDKLEPWQVSGANYAMKPPSRKTARPIGEWNHTRIVLNGGRVEHWLNGVKVVEDEMWTPDWETRVKTGKWKDFPGYGRARRGRIGLQDHGNKIYFRNIKLLAK